MKVIYITLYVPWRSH